MDDVIIETDAVRKKKVANDMRQGGVKFGWMSKANMLFDKSKFYYSSLAGKNWRVMIRRYKNGKYARVVEIRKVSGHGFEHYYLQG